MVDTTIVCTQFEQHYGYSPEIVVRAPGRVNLIGDHTDYNDGFVLPIAIDRTTYIAARPRDDQQVRVVAVDIDDQDAFGLDHIAYSTNHPWSNYVRGVVKEILSEQHHIGGAELLITSDVPRGAGLSSSAALEVAVGYTFVKLYNLEMAHTSLALLAQRAENTFVGVQCGVMDQLISVLGHDGHAVRIDCRDLSNYIVPLYQNTSIVVCNSNMERMLTNSAYNQRREECAEAVRRFKTWYPDIVALRDITPAMFDQHAEALPETVRARARHVVSENARVLRSTTALEQHDVMTFGALMNESHTSLRNDYEVSIPELDILVTSAQQVSGCYGARLTGAGFGGCIVSVVDTNAVESFRQSVAEAYQKATGRDTTIYICRATDGVNQVKG
ncbi:MAG: galactokinase [Chloroflexi bacterium AL-W]|nr:galactokinase [Chloroflexi bacterium AL-N1]NOK66271.1 galactokinase [Chloroflexi bacterium AL-N10]NOK73151.1 galactokinase [Chloroflexi bacterium AL-N5]NOK80048.1 galactokinase [Chloroflexi bacterium AL-W]NOK88097.1 galactokinase [Chloroflexi bacterium AL-N15]